MKKLSVFVSLLLVIPAYAGTIYVDVNATGTNNGSSWADAYKYLQNALTAAGSGSEIWVAQGTYKPDRDTSHPTGTKDQTATFQLKNGVALYGGYPHGGGSRDPNIYVTSLIGDIRDNNSYNSYHVVTGSGTDSTAILDGFTITRGNANSSSSTYYMGGGMYNSSGSPIVTNCTFSRNYAFLFGGGMYNEFSSLTLTNCTFSGNSVSGDGGGMRNESSSSIVTNCIFSSNSASSEGGGMDNDESGSLVVTNCTFNGNSAGYGGGISNNGGSPTITNCTFSGNSASYPGGGGMFNDNPGNPMVLNCTFSNNNAVNGGGMLNGDYSNPTIICCTFSGNSASDSGGGMYDYPYNILTITNCSFSNNSATNSGGGIYSEDNLQTLTNCTFAGNTASDGGGMFNGWQNPTLGLALTNCIFSGNSADYGGGIYNSGSNPMLTNCTFTGNRALGGEGGGIYNYNYSKPTVANCILWVNTAINGSQIYNSSNSTITVSFSDIQGGYSGTGNINADPCFASAATGDLHLSPGSPCIDTANNSAVPIGIETDLDSRDRFVDGDCNTTVIVDMGAFEFSSAYFGDFDSDCYVDFIDFAIFANQWLLEKLPADIAPGRGDGIVNFIDYAVFAYGWLNVNDMNDLADFVSQWLQRGSFNADIAPAPHGDGIVDFSDLAVLCDNWLETF